jgi:TPR repeat protein
VGEFVVFDGAADRRNYAEAMKWFRKAADQGNALGEANLGSLYARGEGVRQDYAEAATQSRRSR